MESPFSLKRIKHPIKFGRILTFIDDITDLEGEQKQFLRAFISYTTNSTVFDKFLSLDDETMNDLANITQIGLKNLRNFGGRPSTQVNTPTGSRNQSPSRKGDLLARATNTRSEIADPQTLSAPVSTDNKYGHNLIQIFGIEREFPKYPETGLARSENFASLCRERQNDYCAISAEELGNFGDTAHIFPYSSLEAGKSSSSITWRFLVLLLGEDLRDKLAEELFTGDFGIHSSANGMYLGSKLHRLFDHGKFSLVPFRHGSTGNIYYLDVQYTKSSRLKIVAELKTWLEKDVKDQYTITEDGNIVCNRIADDRYLVHGDVIRIPTSDPKELPLPSPLLLFWHQFLWRALGVAGLTVPQTEKDRSEPRKRKFAEALGSSPLAKGLDTGEGTSGVGRLGGLDGTVDSDDEECYRNLREFHEFLAAYGVGGYMYDSD